MTYFGEYHRLSTKCIHDDILLRHEIMDKCKNMKGKKTWVALKLDMEEAYGTVEWNLIFDALQRLVFNTKWIAGINECITTVSYLLLINDETCGYFKPFRGIRHRDPLSRHLVIIYTSVRPMLRMDCYNFFV